MSLERVPKPPETSKEEFYVFGRKVTFSLLFFLQKIINTNNVQWATIHFCHCQGALVKISKPQIQTHLLALWHLFLRLRDLKLKL